MLNEAEPMPREVDIRYDRLSLPLQALSRKRQIIRKQENRINYGSAEMYISERSIECGKWAANKDINGY